MGKLGKAKWCLLGCLIVVVVLVVMSVFVPDRLTNSVERVANSNLAGKLRLLVKQEGIREGGLVEMIVESIGVSEINYQPVVILKQQGGELYLPIWIGLAEANAISVIIEGVEVPRPLTPDLLCAIIDRMGASVDYTVITNLQNHTYYANIILQSNSMQMKIDARPSDAIAIALRVRAPIYVEKSVLEKAGVSPEHEIDKYTTIRLENGKTGLAGKYATLQ